MDKIIEKLFKECKSFPSNINYKGNTIVSVDYFPINTGDRVKVIFESTNSKWLQGIRLKIDKELIIENSKGKNFLLWRHNSPDEIIVECVATKSHMMTVYNCWDTGKGSIDAWLGNSGMIVEELADGRRYRCNDGYPDDDFDDLIFRIEKI